VRSSTRSGPPLVFVGRLVAHKRLELLVSAVARLRPPSDGSPILTILGDGPDHDHLQRLLTDLGVSDRVRLVRRLEGRDEVFALLASARIAVQPSAREGFGLFPLEALATGLPVVFCASPESAVGELVRDGVEGLCVAADPNALAEALERLLGDEASISRLGRHAERRAREFEWEKIAARFEEIVRRATSGA
jgi:glycosyltransferase involved in cell wall biosynthesis